MSFYRDHKPVFVIGVGAAALEAWSIYLGADIEGIAEIIVAWLVFCIPMLLFYTWATDENL